MKKTAIMIDGGFFMKRLNYYLRKHFPDTELTGAQIKDVVWSLVKHHLEVKHGNHSFQRPCELFRIYYYDCPPLEQQLKKPLPVKKKIHGEDRVVLEDFNTKKHPPYMLIKDLHSELRKNRKTALRLGELRPNPDNHWNLHPKTLTALIKGEKAWSDLTNNDFIHTFRQKEVDIKLGMDITILSHEKLVDSIVLIAGDSDFVPAAKHARIKGVDFILDALNASIPDSLNEHIDGLQNSDLIMSLEQVCKKQPINLSENYIARKQARQDRRERAKVGQKRSSPRDPSSTRKRSSAKSQPSSK